MPNLDSGASQSKVAMVLVDTTVWIDYFAGTTNPHTLWLDSQLGLQPLGLTDLIYCEVLQGIRADSAFRQIRYDLDRLAIFDTGGTEIALRAAVNYRLLRRRAITVRKTIDCLIATFCIETKQELLHRDRDFDAFESYLGLHVVHHRGWRCRSETCSS